MAKATKAARIIKMVNGPGRPSREVVALANQILSGQQVVPSEVIAQVEEAFEAGPSTSTPPSLRPRRSREVEEGTSEEEETTTEEGDDYPSDGGDDGDGGEASKGECVCSSS